MRMVVDASNAARASIKKGVLINRSLRGCGLIARTTIVRCVGLGISLQGIWMCINS